MGFTSSAGSPLGSSIQAAELDSGSVTYDKLADVDKWELLETLTYSSDTTQTTGTLDAKSEYKAVFDIQGAGSTISISMQINGDTGNNYGYHYRTNADTLGITSGVGSILLCMQHPALKNTGNVRFDGLTPTNASGSIYSIIEITSQLGQEEYFLGSWTGGSAVQVSTLRFFSASNLTGTIKVYGR